MEIAIGKCWGNRWNSAACSIQIKIDSKLVSLFAFIFSWHEMTPRDCFICLLWEVKNLLYLLTDTSFTYYILSSWLLHFPLLISLFKCALYSCEMTRSLMWNESCWIFKVVPCVLSSSAPNRCAPKILKKKGVIYNLPTERDRRASLKRVTFEVCEYLFFNVYELYIETSL